MAEKSGLFNAVGGVPKYNDIDIATMFSLLTGGEGYLVGRDDELEVEVVEGADLEVKVKTGGAWIGNPSGWWYINDEEKSLLIEQGEVGYDRIDRVVLRLDRSNAALSVTAQILKGTKAATNPEVQVLTRNAQVYELSLAQVHIIGESTDVTVTDERDSEFCGALSIGGGGGSLIFTPSVVDSSVENYDVVAWDNVGDKWISAQNGYAIYKDGKLYPCGPAIPVTGHESDDGFRAYVQEDGSYGTAITEYLCGVFCEGGEYLFLCYQGEIGSVKEYTEDMIQFFAVPGVSTKIRIKIEMPTNADGVMIRRKTTAWASGDDETTGTLVANIADDTSYKDDNEWYEATNLLDGTRYYFKAFPYEGGIYNTIIEHNESSAKGGGLVHEYTMDSVSGSILNDTGGSDNGTTHNTSYVSGVISNAMNFNGSNGYVSDISFSNSSDYSVSFFLKADSIRSQLDAIFSNNGDVSPFCAVGYGSVIFGTRYNSFSSTGIATGTWYHIVCQRNSSANTMTVIVDCVAATPQASSATLSVTRLGTMITGGTNKYFDGQVDQLRFFSRVLEDYEISNLYNGGDGC